MIKANNPQNWTKAFIILLFSFIIIFIALSELILHRINEGYSGEALVKKYITEDILYGSALSDNIALYKLSLVKEKKPKIVAIGSSRVMQFRQEFFKKTAYTMGGTIGTLDDAIYIIDEIYKVYEPELIIIGVDLWWLNPNCSHQPQGRDFDTAGDISRRLYRYSSLWENIRKNKNVRARIIDPQINGYDLVEHRKTVGLQAGYNSSGYRSIDGSYQYGHLTLAPKTYEERLKDTQERINEERGQFMRAYHLDKNEVRKLDEILARLENKNCKVIVFLPPFAHEIYEQMLESDGHNKLLLAFEDKVKEISQKHGAIFYDFSDITWIDCDPQRILDGFHGDDTAYRAICHEFGNRKELSEWINS